MKYGKEHAKTVMGYINNDTGDAMDYRAMLAREVWKERVYRVYGDATRMTPASLLEHWGDTALREHVERQNGEPLL